MFLKCFQTGLGISSTVGPSTLYPQHHNIQQHNSINNAQGVSPSVPSLSFDPSTKTLFIDSSSAHLLNLQDGDTIPLPDHILQQVRIFLLCLQNILSHFWQ